VQAPDALGLDAHASLGAPVDRCAVASVICGLTAFVPVLSQVASIVLGVIALRRIRRDQRLGVVTRGRRLAAIGIASGVLALLGWVSMAAGLLILRDKISQSTGALQQVKRAIDGPN